VLFLLKIKIRHLLLLRTKLRIPKCSRSSPHVISGVLSIRRAACRLIRHPAELAAPSSLPSGGGGGLVAAELAGADKVGIGNLFV